MPKISIITTVYKHQDFIAETIESILSQTFTDWELLIWDDSPDDLTWNIIQAYVNKYPDKIKAWHNNPNKWIVDNMNFLLENVSVDSEYVAFLEWDDLYAKDNLEEKLKIFEKHTEVWMVYNNLDFIDEKWSILEKNYFKCVKKVIKNERLDLDEFLFYLNSYFSFSTMMIKTSIFKDIKIESPNNDKKFLNSDCIFFAEVWYNYNLYGIEKELTHYRRHWNNSSNNFNLSYDALISINYLIKKYNLKNSYFRLYLTKSFLSYLENNKKDAIYYWILSFKYNIRYKFIRRFGVIILSLLPRVINKFIFNIYRSIIWRKSIKK